MRKQTAFLRLFSGVLIILVLLGMGSSASVLQATDKVVNAAAPTSSVTAETGHVLVVPAAAFRHDGNFPNVGFYSFWGGYWRGDSANTPCYMAPVYLPRVADIYQVWATVYDNDDAGDFFVTLFKVENYTGTVSTIAELSSSGASTSLTSIYDTSVQDEVRYPQYSYYLGTCLSSSSHRLYNVRVWYSNYEIHLPLINR